MATMVLLDLMGSAIQLRSQMNGLGIKCARIHRHHSDSLEHQ
jgi:hypothetical protein